VPSSIAVSGTRDATAASSPSSVDSLADSQRPVQTAVQGLLMRHGECHQTETGGWSCWPSQAKVARDAPDTNVDRDLEIFRITADHFRHDLVALWNHSSYFLLIQGALFSVFAGIIGHNSRSGTGLTSAFSEDLFIVIVGLIFALFWSWAAWRRVKLIELWRHNVVHLDGVVDQHGVYLRVEPSVSQRWWFGPSALTARLPWLVAFMWIIVMCWVLIAH
jgi:hypothetical protein